MNKIKINSGWKKSRLVLPAVLSFLLTIGLAFGFLFGNSVNANAYTSANRPASIGSLTLSDYDTRTDGYVFDADVLQTIYDRLTGTTGSTYQAAYNAVNSSSSTVTGSVSAGTAALGTNVNAWTQQHAKDFAAINGSSPFSVEFGGFTWNAVYATTNTTSTTNGTPDLILTLWMSESQGSSVWNSYSDRNAGAAYPSSMYSTSRIRAEALNAGGDAGVNYATSTTARGGTVSNRQGHQFAQFTLSDNVIGQKSLTDYLVSPNKVGYQENENWNWSYMGNGRPYLLPNEAWGSPDESVLHGAPSTGANRSGGWCRRSYNSAWDDIYLIPQNTAYGEWAEDLLWLPSLTETGFYDNGNSYGRSLWGIPDRNNILSNGGNTWLRSGNNRHATNCFGLTAAGGDSVFTATTSAGVRPALHLNLTSAAPSAAGAIQKPIAPSALTYDRTEKTFDLSTLTNWDSSKMEVVQIERDGGTAHSAPSVVAPASGATATQVKLTDAGTYKVTLRTKTTQNSANETQNWLFAGTPPAAGTRETTVEIRVNKARLAVPSFGTAAARTKDYDGTAQTFTASGYPSANVTGYPRDPLSVAVTKTDGALVGAAPATTATAQSTLEVRVRNSGEYRATFTITDSVNYEWSDGTGATKDATFSLRKKRLSVTSQTTKNNLWGWAANDTESGTITVSGVFGGDTDNPADSVDLLLAVVDDSNNATSYLAGVGDGNGAFTFTIDKDISAFGGSYPVGTFWLRPVLGAGAGAAHDGNYEFNLATDAGNANGFRLVVSAAGAGLSSYDLLYDDGSGSQPMPAGNKVPFKLNAAGSAGVTYTVSLDTQSFPAYLSVDTSYNQNGFTNGYKNNTAANAGSYTAEVHLRSNDPAYLFSNGTQEGDVSVAWEIEKASFDNDLAGAKWQYTDNNGNTADYPARWNQTLGAWEYLDETGAPAADAGLPWYGADYTLTLTGLPLGITVNNPTGAYTGNRQKAINSSYHAVLGNVTYDTVNFNALPPAFLEFDWSIVKGRIEIVAGSWSTFSQGEGSNIFYVPTLQNVSGVDYEYYDLGTDANPIAYPGTQLTGLSDITSAAGTTHHYYVKAVIRSGFSIDGVTLWSDAIEIIDRTGGGSFNGTQLGDNTRYFFTGDNRTPVQVMLNGAPYSYDKQPHGVLDDGTNGGDLVITVGSNAFPASNFTVNYYERDLNNAADHNKGAQLAGAPVHAGNYVLEIVLSAAADSSYYATDEYVEFEIKPYTFDMSQLKWGYLDENGNEIEYNPSAPPEYKLNADGTPFVYELVLIGLPKGDVNGDDAARLLAELLEDSDLAGIFSYTGQNSSAAVTNTGSMTATGEIDTTALGSDYELGSLPYTVDQNGIASASQNWNIDPKKINTPKSDATHSFTGDALDILSFTGLDPAGLGVYYNLTGLTKRDSQNNPQSLFTAENCADPNSPTLDEVKAVLAGIKDAGRYGVTVEIIDRNNVKFVENGVVGTLPTYSAQVTVNKLTVQIVGWQGDGNAPWTPSYASADYPANIVESKFTDVNGNVVPVDDLIYHYNEQFTQTIAPVAGNEDNVIVEFVAGADSEKSFLMLDQGNPPDPIEKPSEISSPNAVFTGNAQSFMPAGLEALLNQGRIALFTVDGEGNETRLEDAAAAAYFTQTNAGEYRVIARIVGNYYWDGTNNDKTPIEYVFEIAPARVTPVWTLDSNGKPVASLPAGFENFRNVFDYHFTDENGNEVAEGDLVADSVYSVGASLKPEYADNFTLVDDGGAEITGGVAPYGEPYVHPKSGFMGFVTRSFWFGLPMWVWLIILVVVLILLLILIIVLVKGRKKRAEKRLAAKEKKEEEERIKQEKQEEKERREEERQRREEEREDERRRREDERRLAGMGMGAVAVQPQQPVQPAQAQPAQTPDPRIEKLEEELKRRDEEMRKEIQRRDDEQREAERKREEERLAQMKADAEREAERLKAEAQKEAERLKAEAQKAAEEAAQKAAQKAAEEAKAQQIVAPAPVATVKYAGTEDSEVDAETYARLREYEERLRSMERELQERKMESLVREENERARKEMEDAARMRRHEEEMQRLRDLQDFERRQRQTFDSYPQPPLQGFAPPQGLPPQGLPPQGLSQQAYGTVYPAPYDAEELQRKQQQLEYERLKLLEEQLKQKERENQMLQDQLRARYSVPSYGQGYSSVSSSTSGYFSPSDPNRKDNK